MARYGREVLKRICREEIRRRNGDRSIKARFRKAKRLLVREERLLDEEAHQTLQKILEESRELETAYRLRRQLQSVWQSAYGPEQVRFALRDWCRQADATGIAPLRRFARRLCGLRLRDT